MYNITLHIYCQLLFVFKDNSWSTSECGQADQIFNPYNKSVTAVYNRDCNPANAISCKLGDMDKEFSPIEIVPYKLSESGTVNLKKYYFVDSFLPLCGPNSVVGKSIQINEPNHSSEALSCTNLVLLDSEDQDYI